MTYLRAGAPGLVIEVDATDGDQPDGGSLDHLRSVLAGVLDKPSGIDVDGPSAIGPARDGYTREDLRALEAVHRDTSSGSRRSSMYVLVVGGSYAPDESVLGLAYSASAFAIFRPGIERAGGLLGSPGRVERSVFVHEAGHLLSLVNIGYTSPRPHADPDHPHHSSNDRSVMHWAVESDAIGQVLGASPPDDFDADDRADLADLRAGRL